MCKNILQRRFEDNIIKKSLGKTPCRQNSSKNKKKAKKVLTRVTAFDILVVLSQKGSRNRSLKTEQK